MEPTEIHEFADRLQEANERTGESLKTISLAISILAVFVAMVTVLGHRSHTEELLLQAKASDQWAYYQAKNIRLHEMEAVADMLAVLSPGDKEKVVTVHEKYVKEVERYEKDKDQISDKAKEFENERAVLTRREDRFDAGEVILEIALIICSLTLLTKKKAFWYSGMAIGVFGFFVGVSGFLVR